MLDDTISEKDMQKKDNFVRRKILNKSKNIKNRVKKGIITIILGMLFGSCAALAFVLLVPRFDSVFWGMEENTSAPLITIPIDEETVVIGLNETEVQETEPIQEIVENAIKKNELDFEDYKNMTESLGKIAKNAEKSIVSINASRTEVGLFDENITKSGSCAGIIVYKTSQEILIITSRDLVMEADILDITFEAGLSAPGIIKQSDSITNIAIVSVQSGAFETKIADKITPIALGNSNLISKGDAVLAIGNPSGNVYSFVHGFVSSINNNISITDGVWSVLDIDCNALENSNSFFINLKGELVGIGKTSASNVSNSGFVSAMPISELKPLIEKLSNGGAKAYLGITGIDITEAMSHSMELPKGIYIQSVIEGSPAYDSGLQRGDVIVDISDTEILRLKDFQTFMNAKIQGESILVKVMRFSVDDYKELVFEVKLGSR
jgi:Trypsin-like serine proteases, typically periplasmic, contain C-terminal PDZ domain